MTKWSAILLLTLGLWGCAETDSPAPAISESAAVDGAGSGSAPDFQVDPFWPNPLPDGWLLGNVVGVATDSGDNV